MTVRAAGAVLWRPGGEIALVHRPAYDDWSLPKGKVDGDEPLPCTARREVTEETGYDAALGRWVAAVRYRVGDVAKRVDYWAARAGAVAGDVHDDVDGVEWLAPDAALARLSYQTDRSVCHAWATGPPATSTVLLVRHAKAGSRDAWHGPDDERPLDAGGRAQVEALRTTLPAFWLRAERPYVVSAPVTRCVETVAWAGEVSTEERLGERADPAATAAYLRELAARDVSVACSQGGVIPAAIEVLRRADGLRPARVRAAKGSAWVLSFSAGRLVAADYVDAA
jgi:8-oxo-dGTP pyrophosphatase MutT (NUDIX family)